MVAPSILTHLTEPSYSESAFPSGRKQPDIAVFERDGEVLCLEPISGQWAISTPRMRQEIYADLMRKRLEWLRNPASNEIGIPASPVTVSVANCSPDRLENDLCKENGNPDGCLPAEQVLKFIRFVEALHPDRNRLFVFQGRRHLLDWLSFESLVVRYRREGVPPTGTTRFMVLIDPTIVTRDIACRLRELNVDAHVSMESLPGVRGAAGRHGGSPATFERAMRGCEWLRQCGINPCTITTIVDPADLLRIFQFLCDHGFTGMLMRSRYRAGSVEAASSKMAEFEAEDVYHSRFAAGLMDVADFILDHNRTEVRKVIEYGLGARVSRLSRRNRSYEGLSSSCGATSGYALGLDGKGSLFPCAAMFGLPGLAVGHLASANTAADFANMLATAPACMCLRKRQAENIDRCIACPVQRFCGAECAADSYARYGALNRESPWCVLEQTLFVELLWKVARDSRNVEWLCPVELQADLFSSCQWGAYA